MKGNDGMGKNLRKAEVLSKLTMPIIEAVMRASEARLPARCMTTEGLRIPGLTVSPLTRANWMLIVSGGSSQEEDALALTRTVVPMLPPNWMTES